MCDRQSGEPLANGAAMFLSFEPERDENAEDDPDPLSYTEELRVAAAFVICFCELTTSRGYETGTQTEHTRSHADTTVEERNGVLVAVDREMAIVKVDHRDARTHEP